jgi:hypothetical protein
MQQMKRSHQHLATGAIAAQSPLPESLAALAYLTRGPSLSVGCRYRSAPSRNRTRTS